MGNEIRGGTFEILLVEDNPGDVRLVTELLRNGRLEKKISVAKDGVEAMNFLRKEGKYSQVPDPDLVLLDLNLPRKDGREVLSEMKADPRLKDIPVVVLTTSEAEQDISQSSRFKVARHFIKPLDLEEFEKVIHSIEEFCISTRGK